jgi:carboxyl-terminal processing protease
MMPENNDIQKIAKSSIIASAIILLGVGFGGGFASERYLVQSGASNAIVGSVPPPADVDMSPVWKAWGVIDEKFVPAAVASTTPIATSTAEENQDRVWGMVEGLAASLNDPYTFFLPPQQNQDFTQDMSGSFEGVGMQIDIKNGILTVVSPLKGTPSEKAGIKADDQILKIDDVDTKGMDVNTAVTKIRGPRGSQVRLLIGREGWDAPKEIKVTRDTITVPIVATQADTHIKNIPSDVYVISVSTFTSNSPDLFRNAMRDFIKSGKHKLVIDLRGNPGGYLEAAVDMASWFLPAGDTVVTEDYNGHADNVVHRSLGYDVVGKNVKVAILVDKGSASASEILSDALRHYGVAKLVGTNTFGKGSVQELVEITPETSLKVTVARWLGPDGIQIPHDGLVPDIMATTSDELIKAGKDPQMDAAVRYLNQ